MTGRTNAVSGGGLKSASCGLGLAAGGLSVYGVDLRNKPFIIAATDPNVLIETSMSRLLYLYPTENGFFEVGVNDEGVLEEVQSNVTVDLGFAGSSSIAGFAFHVDGVPATPGRNNYTCYYA